MEEQQINIDPSLLKELSNSIKSEKDLSILSKQLLKLTLERAMDAELDDHLGYSKHSIEDRNTGNSRNGYSLKRLKGDFVEMG
ncbi:transposase, partial [Candidatus Cardinium hertigii]|uniref:transposase n=1 Tax=Candidatus Cardinium hertigii TaxID=247481 RepID=UPI003D7D48E7